MISNSKNNQRTYLSSPKTPNNQRALPIHGEVFQIWKRADLEKLIARGGAGATLLRHEAFCGSDARTISIGRTPHAAAWSPRIVLRQLFYPPQERG